MELKNKCELCGVSDVPLLECVRHVREDEDSDIEPSDHPEGDWVEGDWTFGVCSLCAMSVYDSIANDIRYLFDTVNDERLTQ